MLKKHGFIGINRERCREYARHFSGTGLLQTYTLNDFVAKIFGELDKSKRVSSGLEDALLMEKAVNSLELSHFSYLQGTGGRHLEGLKQMSQYFHLVDMSETSLDDLCYDAKKASELKALKEAIDTLREEKGIVTLPCQMDRVLNHLDDDVLKDYDSFVIDSFELNEGLFLAPLKKERALIERLNRLTQTRQWKPAGHSQIGQISFNRVYSRLDEVSEAAGIAKQLLSDGVSPEDVLIVAGSLSPYESVIHEVFSQWGLEVFVPNGVALKHLPVFSTVLKYFSKYTDIDKAISFTASQFKTIDGIPDIHLPPSGQLYRTLNQAALGQIMTFLKECRFHNLSAETARVLFEKSLRDTKVVAKTGGLLVQELNQAVLKRGQHAILLGVDSDTLPPVPEDSFLFSGHQLETVFGQNNSNRLSRGFLESVLKGFKQVHVVCGRNDMGKELSVAQVLLDCVPGLENMAPFKMTGMAVPERELLNTGRRPFLNRQGERFIDCMRSQDMTEYDGALGEYTHGIEHVSVSQLDTYAGCPLKYFFSYVLNLDPGKDDQAGFDVMEKGSLMHKVFEVFGRDVKEGTIVLPDTLTDEVKGAIRDIAFREYHAMLKKYNYEDNVFYRMHYQELIDGLDGGETQGPLITFLEWIFDEEKPGHYRLSRLKDVEYKVHEKGFDIDGTPVKGVIDRVDEAGSHVTLIDYKSTKPSRQKNDDLLKKIEDLKSFQLPVYMMYILEKSPGVSGLEAFLFSLKTKEWNEYCRLSCSHGTVGFHYSDDVVEKERFLEDVKDRVLQIIERIRHGHFEFSLEEDACQWCSYIPMCHRALLNKGGEV